MDSFVTKTSASEKSAIDIKCAKWFYACAIPFAAVEHPTFTQFTSALRAGYQPPTRKAIGWY